MMNTERDAAIVEAVRSGKTYQAVGLRYGLTHARVQQIVRKLDPSFSRQKRGRTHGTHSTYNSGCRCEPCKKGHHAYQIKARNRRYSGPIPSSVKHGRVATYGNWGCRCPDCSDAYAVRHRPQQRRYDAKRRAARAGNP